MEWLAYLSGTRNNHGQASASLPFLTLSYLAFALPVVRGGGSGRSGPKSDSALSEGMTYRYGNLVVEVPSEGRVHVGTSTRRGNVAQP